MAEQEVSVDTSKITGTQKKLTLKGAWFYIIRVAIIITVSLIMFFNRHKSDCNLIAMIFFAVIGISSMIEIGFKIDNVTKNITKFKD